MVAGRVSQAEIRGEQGLGHPSLVKCFEHQRQETKVDLQLRPAYELRPDEREPWCAAHMISIGGGSVAVNVVSSPSDRLSILRPMTDRTQRPFAQELPELLRERQMSIRQLSRQAGVGNAHLSRLLRGVGYRTKPSKELARRVAEALDLKPDYFLEYREAVVIEAIREQPQLREELYDRLTKRR